MFSFSMKAEFKRRPYIGASVLAGLVVLLSGVVMHVFERAVSDDFSNIWNGFWIIGITISTVGYGDIVPKTHVGRIVCTVASILGLYAISYAVNSVQITFSISDESESSIAGTLEYRQKLTGETKVIAGTLIQRWWKLQLKRRINAPRIKELSQFVQFLKRFTGFRTRSLKLQDPTLNDIAGSIEREAAKEFVKLSKHLSSMERSKREVRAMQCNRLKLEAYVFESNSSKFAVTLGTVLNSIFPRRRESYSMTAVVDRNQLSRRQGFSRKRATIAKTSSQAMKTMMRRLNTRKTKPGYSPVSGDSSVGELSSSFYQSMSPEPLSPMIAHLSSLLEDN